MMMEVERTNESGLVGAEFHALLDRFEDRVVDVGGGIQLPGECLRDFPVKHHFAPGLYMREIFMPKHSIVLSRVHKTEHPFIISQGDCDVLMEGMVWQRLRAPHSGITKAGTRRLLVIREDTIWLTVHRTDLTDPVEIDAEILEPVSERHLARRLAEGS